MKKFAKVCLIISLIFLGISAVCTGVGVAMGSSLKELGTMVKNGEFTISDNEIFGSGYEIDDTGNDKDDDNVIAENSSNNGTAAAASTEKDASANAADISNIGDFRAGSFVSDEIASLDVNIKYGKVTFVNSNSDQIEINITSSSNHTYTCVNESGTLKLEETTDSIGINENRIRISVAIPVGKVFQDVAIRTNAGKLEADHIFQATAIYVDLDAGSFEAEGMHASGTLDVGVDAGSLDIEDMQAGELIVVSGVGEADVSGTVSGNITAECGVGQISLDLYGKVEDYNYDAMGNVSINDEQYTSYLQRHHSDYYRTHNGSSNGNGNSDDYTNYGAANNMKLRCGLGKIEVDFE